MGAITSTLIPDWRKSPAIQRLIEAHMFKEAKVIDVTLIIRKDHPTTGAKKYAEIIYMLGGKLFRAELKLRDDRHWDMRRKNVKDKDKDKGSHFTASDLLGETRVP